MTTDANKKGDLVDLFTDLKLKGLIGEPSHIADYPETVQSTLKIFIKAFGLPNGAIPSRRSKGKFANWIMGLQELEQICPVGMEEMMQACVKRYEDMGKCFLIYQPQSIRKILIDVVAERNRLADQLKETEEIHNQVFVDGKTITKEFEDLFED